MYLYDKILNMSYFKYLMNFEQLFKNIAMLSGDER